MGGGAELRYSYPLIQYKALGGKAAIVCVGEGLQAVWDFFEGGSFRLDIGRREVFMQVEDIKSENTEIAIYGSALPYSLRSWLPLNEENYHRYLRTDSLAGRISMLEHILTGNILSMLKGCGITIDETISVNLTSLSDPRPVSFKRIPLAAFDASFKANISLPSHIGLGRHVSVGFGTLFNERE